MTAVSNDEVAFDRSLVRWDEVDGVPVAWTHSSQRTKLSALLVFRVGKIDEGLHFNGISHLVEHLALYSVGRPPHFMNGAVAAVTTSFVVGGEPADVVSFMSKLTSALRRLPLDRLPAEIRVLEAEAGRRGGGLYDELMYWRYGQAGLGLSGMSEYGCQSMSGGQLQAWADQRMTKENCVLVLSGPPPAGLTLDLASGVRHAVPPLYPLVRYLPGSFEHRGNDVGFSAVVSRTPALPALLHFLNEVVSQRLRHELAVAYSPSVMADPYNADFAHIVGQADSHPSHTQQVVDALVAALNELAARGLTAEALRSFRERYVVRVADESAAAGWALWEARQHLLGAPSSSAFDAQQESANVTGEEVRELARQVASTALYALPGGCHLSPSVAQPMTKYYIGPALDGTPISAAAGAQLSGKYRLGPQGITFTDADGRSVSVAFDGCVAVLAWPDGARRLVNRDGTSIQFEPVLFESGVEAVTAIDAATVAVRVPMPARGTESIPRLRPIAQQLRQPTPPPMPHNMNRAAAIAQYLLRHRRSSSLRIGLVVVAFLVAGVTALWWTSAPRQSAPTIGSSSAVPEDTQPILPARVILSRAIEAASAQHSAEASVQLSQHGATVLVQERVFGSSIEVQVNDNGHYIDSRMTPAGVFSLITPLQVGTGSEGYWVRMTASVAQWRRMSEQMTPLAQLRRIKFQGSITRVESVDQPGLVGVQGNLGKGVSGTLWVNARTMLPVSWQKTRGAEHAMYQFENWGQAAPIKAPSHWVDRAVPPPPSTGA